MEIEKRKSMGRYSGVGIFSSKIKCGECGGWYGSKVWHSTDKYRKVIYRCNHKYVSGCKCQTSHITEDELKDLFLKVSDDLYQGREEIIADTKAMMEPTCDTKKLEKERDDYATKLNVVSEQMQMLIASNSRVAQDQNEYQGKYDELAQSYDALKKGYDQATEEIQSKQAQAEQFKTFIATMEKAESATVFDESYWESLVDYVTITKENTVVFTIKNGQEIEIER